MTPAVEATRPQQRRVQYLRTVGGRQHDHSLVAGEPSISVRIWLSVCSRSSLAPVVFPELRERPIASSSSMKMIEGASALAVRTGRALGWRPRHDHLHEREIE
jgi:hypothetical protein